VNPQVRDIVQNVLITSCAPHTRTDGGYFGQTPPDTTAQFNTRLEDNLASFKYNSWDLASLDKLIAIQDGNTAYKNTYGGWLAQPLSGDAPPEVVAWYNNAKASGV
jgi:hypothetical protein